MPWSGSSFDCTNQSVPIAAIVILRQDHENRVSRLCAEDAILQLLPNIIAPKWEPTLYNKALDRLDEIVPEIPIYLLRCRPDEDAMYTLKREMDRLLNESGKG